MYVLYSTFGFERCFINKMHSLTYTSAPSPSDNTRLKEKFRWQNAAAGSRSPGTADGSNTPLVSRAQCPVEHSSGRWCLFKSRSPLQKQSYNPPQQVIGPVNHPVGALWCRDSSPCLGLKWAVLCSRDTPVLRRAARGRHIATFSPRSMYAEALSALWRQPRTRRGDFNPEVLWFFSPSPPSPPLLYLHFLLPCYACFVFFTFFFST